jgi:hypothetical protein
MIHSIQQGERIAAENAAKTQFCRDFGESSML